MADYFLFLDELKNNNIYSHFCLGGLFIEDVYYRKTIIPYVNDLKNKIFGKTSVVLHEKEIYNAKNDYAVFKHKDKEEEFWLGMKKLIENYDVKTVCVGIDVNKFKNTYPNKGIKGNSEYYVALQIILENFVHFLSLNKSRGSVYIESRGLIPDYELKEQYEIIRNNGTLFVSPEVFQDRLKTISFPLKADNNIGIQLADFIPNPIARYFSAKNQKEYSLYESIKSKSYDGGTNLVERFGIKKVL